jgi:RHS repeat-associated protein
MRVFRIQTDGAAPSVYTQYLYGSSGQRVMKSTYYQGGNYETTVYIGNVFEHQRSITAAATVENNSIHVMDNRTRIAIVRVGNALPGDAAPNVPIKYHFSDHLGSSNLVVDITGAWINREEYLPYGETSFGSFARKRYRFTGKERDEESGFNYHGARYYAPWLARWTSCDPAGLHGGYNSYEYCHGAPTVHIDDNGRNPLLLIVLVLAIISFKHDDPGGSDIRPVMSLTPPGAAVAAFSYGYEAGHAEAQHQMVEKQLQSVASQGNQGPASEERFVQLTKGSAALRDQAITSLVSGVATAAFSEPTAGSRAPLQSPKPPVRVNLLEPKPLQPRPAEVGFGPPRSGGSPEAARQYAYQVTGGAEKATYVQGPPGTSPVEFEGVNGGVLVEAKRASGRGSFYDISGPDKFTLQVKIPRILEQEERQVRALQSSGQAAGLKGIEWRVADEMVANQLQDLMNQKGLPITVTAVPAAKVPAGN